MLAALGGCASETHPNARSVTQRVSAIQLECSEALAADADWLCPVAFSVSCDGSATTPFRVQVPRGASCAGRELSLVQTPSLAGGAATLELQDALGETLCTSTVTTLGAPSTLVASEPIALWPPNHKFHEIRIDDCIAQAGICDDLSGAAFVWASSDEGVNDIGDGNHEPDILIAEDCQAVKLRSERQGPSDGRVYKLGVRIPNASGVSAELVCEVVVTHDQSGVAAADSGEAYRVTFDGTQGGPICTGTPPPTEPPSVRIIPL